MKPRIKRSSSPVAQSVSHTIELTETQAKLIEEGSRFFKMNLQEYMVSAVTYRTVEILSSKKGFLKSKRYRKLFLEALE